MCTSKKRASRIRRRRRIRNSPPDHVDAINNARATGALRPVCKQRTLGMVRYFTRPNNEFPYMHDHIQRMCYTRADVHRKRGIASPSIHGCIEPSGLGMAAHAIICGRKRERDAIPPLPPHRWFRHASYLESHFRRRVRAHCVLGGYDACHFPHHHRRGPSSYAHLKKRHEFRAPPPFPTSHPRRGIARPFRGLKEKRPSGRKTHRPMRPKPLIPMLMDMMR